VWYLPVPGESTNCEPPTDVHASTKITTAGTQSPAANRSSTSSITDGRNADRFRHMSICPVRPWIR
jgi:hypothetical protein